MARTISPGEVEYAGAMEFRFFEVDITNYDSDTTGDGEAFSPSDAGMSRFQRVICEVDPNAGSGANNVVAAVAQYDYTNQSIRLFGHDAGDTGVSGLTELGSDNNEGAVVKVTAIGR